MPKHFQKQWTKEEYASDLADTLSGSVEVSNEEMAELVEQGLMRMSRRSVYLLYFAVTAKVNALQKRIDDLEAAGYAQTVQEIEEKNEIVGQVSVDAGIVMVGDPCYYLHGKNPDQFGSTWTKFCSILDKKQLDKKMAVELGQQDAVVVRAGYGDGVYPVQVKREANRIKELRIKFY